MKRGRDRCEVAAVWEARVEAGGLIIVSIRRVVVGECGLPAVLVNRQVKFQLKKL